MGQRLTDKADFLSNARENDRYMIVDSTDTTGSAQGTSKSISGLYQGYWHKVSLTSAQVSNLHNTPVLILGAPPSGTHYVIIQCFFTGYYNSTTTTNNIFTYLTTTGAPAPAQDNVWSSIYRFMRSKTTGPYIEQLPPFTRVMQPESAKIWINTNGQPNGNYSMDVNLFVKIFKM